MRLRAVELGLLALCYSAFAYPDLHSATPVVQAEADASRSPALALAESAGPLSTAAGGANPDLSLAASSALAEPDLRVQLSASRRTVISSELAGKVVHLTLKEGDRFSKGERLLGFDCAIHRARLGHSAAAQEAANRKLGVARKLDQLQSISVSDLSQAQAELSMARAQNGVNQVLVQHCTINAPFAGRVAERKVQPGEYVAEGKELLAIYDDSAFEVELIVPSRWLSWLKPGYRFSVHLDETGTDYPAEVERLGAVIDPLSQSIKVFGQLQAPAGQLLPGMSGSARIAPPAGSDT